MCKLVINAISIDLCICKSQHSTPGNLEAACRSCSSRRISSTAHILPDALATISWRTIDTSSFKIDLARCHYRGRRDWIYKTDELKRVKLHRGIVVERSCIAIEMVFLDHNYAHWYEKESPLDSNNRNRGTTSAKLDFESVEKSFSCMQ